MLLNSTTGLVILGLVLVAGWLLGLASSTGGKKWKARYLAERDAHAAYRRDADARVTDAERRHAELDREHTAYRTDSDRRYAELERERLVDRDVHTQTAARPAVVHPSDRDLTDRRPVDTRPGDQPGPIGSTVITPNRSRDIF